MRLFSLMQQLGEEQGQNVLQLRKNHLNEVCFDQYPHSLRIRDGRQFDNAITDQLIMWSTSVFTLYHLLRYFLNGIGLPFLELLNNKTKND